MTEYAAKGFNDTTQYPEAQTFVDGKKDNLPFGTTIPSIATAAAIEAVTGLDDTQAQQVVATDSGAVYISVVGATTYTAAARTVATVTAVSGAIALTSDIVYFDTTVGASTATLADGTAGQEIVMQMLVDGGAQVVTPANLLVGTTITFDDVGDSVTLKFDGTNWGSIGTATATIA